MRRTHRGVALLAAGTLLVALLGCSPVASADESRPQPRSFETAPPAADEAEPSSETAAVTALDQYVESERAQVPNILAATGGTYSALEVAADHPSTVRFDYVYAQAVDPSEARAYFDSMIPALQELCDTQVFPKMTASGVANPTALYRYYNPDGSELWSRTFESS